MTEPNSKYSASQLTKYQKEVYYETLLRERSTLCNAEWDVLLKRYVY